MDRKVKFVSIVIYLLQYLLRTYFSFLHLVVLPHQKPIMNKHRPNYINNLKHHSSMMSISRDLILGIAIIDCLIDRFINTMQVIYHTINLDTQLFDTRNMHQLQDFKRILSISILNRLSWIVYFLDILKTKSISSQARSYYFILYPIKLHIKLPSLRLTIFIFPSIRG